MIDKLFKKYDEKSLQLDLSFIAEKLGDDFMKRLIDAGGSGVISELKFDADRRAAFAYYRVKNDWFSFAWDKKNEQLLFSKKLTNVFKNKPKWKFIVGWKHG